MSEQVVAKMGLLSPTDAPSVSSVLEEMFEFFDGRVLRRANYRIRPADRNCFGETLICIVA